MAIDCALMERARRTGESVLRVYSWSAPVLSLGRNQRARNVYDDDALRRHGIQVVRRPTGGRALLHHREITYSVTSPVADGGGLATAYREVNAILLQGLRAIGVEAQVVPAGVRTRAPDPTPCFAEPASGELVANGRKLAGSAQLRDASAWLQHGAILIEDDQTLIPRLMRFPAAATAAPATLMGVLGRAVSPQELSDALFVVVCAMDPHARSLLPAELSELGIDELLWHFRDPDWTWRR